LSAALGEGKGPFGALGATRLRTLLVDDRGSVRAAVRLAMELHGGFLVVAEAAEGTTAVELARRHQPDLVVLDLVMPGQGGLDALPAIRAAAPGAAIVLLTASDDEVPPSAVDQTRGLFDKASDLSSLVDRMAEATRSTSAA
jgi:DNA-binding NarL/FixJ family response regulator